MVLILLACATPEEADSGPTFAVTGVNPEDGTPDVVEAVVPQLRFSGELDVASCAADAFRVDGIDAGQQVAFGVPVLIVASEGGSRVALDPDGPLPRGWTYAVTARGEACFSLDGLPLRPFYSSFTVP